MAHTVQDILNRKGGEVAAVEKSASVLDAAVNMNDLRIGCVVVKEGDKVIGIFTERDILTRVVAQRLDPASTLVGEVMTSPVAVCKPTTSLAEIQSVMTEKRIRHLPVVDQGKLVGMVSSGDVTASRELSQSTTIEYLHQYIYGRT